MPNLLSSIWIQPQPQHPRRALSIPIRVSLPTRSLPEERGSAQAASLWFTSLSLVYVVKDKAANLWMQPLDGSPGHQITNFTTDLSTGFRWSPDCKTLAVMRTHSTSDVVVLRETNEQSARSWPDRLTHSRRALKRRRGKHDAAK